MLEDLIQRGELEIGERLPSERQLVDRLAVSRTVVREAITRLASRGVLRVESGRGAYVVATPELALNGRWQAWMGTDGVKMLGILEVREVLEVPAAGWAAGRASQADLEVLVAAHAAFCEKVEQSADITDITAADRFFHLKLVTCTHNSMLMTIVHDINEMLALGRRSNFVPVDNATHSAAEHARIVEAVVARSESEAQKAMRAHIRRVARDVGRTLATETTVTQ